MIKIGTDLVEIRRIEKSIQSERFTQKVFGADERAELQSRGMPPQSAAGAFAAKEAFAKALGTGIRGFALHEVQLLHDQNGAPFLQLSGRAEQIRDRQNLQLSVSVTHTKELAQAVVLAYEKNKSE